MSDPMICGMATEMPFETTVVSPPHRNNVASVAINDGMPSWVMISPLARPRTVPVASAARQGQVQVVGLEQVAEDIACEGDDGWEGQVHLASDGNQSKSKRYDHWRRNSRHETHIHPVA